MELLPDNVDTLLTAEEVLGGVLDKDVVPLGAERILQVRGQRARFT